MRLVDLPRFLSPVLMVVAIARLGTRRRLVRRFERAEAWSPGRAIALGPLRPLGAWWLRRLQAAGVLAATPEGRHWLARDRWAAYRGVRRRRGMVIAALLLGAALALFLVQRVRGPG